MKQETLIQIIALIFIALLSLFYNPLSANLEGKLVFFGIIMTILLLFIFIDLYNLIESNSKRIKLFNEKLSLLERIKNLENFKKSIENEKK
ncbi:hypothetical protein CMI38_04140 [Candidatus Pacearchaeota archaeon]|jgi:uncharacterized membrane protein YbhN (UPF0104 family)|nr:hypothetical protein [Candidatus Pacearchaeota archaeon]|tara:strand:+ start:516 stop:788 length:273 start_codon:yes stop_codon:yes gene_type:complete